MYGSTEKRWDIEVLFQMAKRHLKLAKEIQVRDFDSHTTIVFMRHMFVAYRVRMENDQRSFGDLFRACCKEVGDIGFMEAVYRSLTFAIQSLEDGAGYCREDCSEIQKSHHRRGSQKRYLLKDKVKI